MIVRLESRDTSYRGVLRKHPFDRTPRDKSVLARQAIFQLIDKHDIDWFTSRIDPSDFVTRAHPHLFRNQLVADADVKDFPRPCGMIAPP